MLRRQLCKWPTRRQHCPWSQLGLRPVANQRLTIISVRPLHCELSCWRPITEEDLCADLFLGVIMSITGRKLIKQTCCRQQLWHLGHVSNFIDDLKYNKLVRDVEVTLYWISIQHRTLYRVDPHSKIHDRSKLRFATNCEVCFNAKNLCPSATVVRVHDGVLAE